MFPVRYFSILVAVGVLASLGPVVLVYGQLECGLPDPVLKVQPVIIGGEATDAGVWPWQLSLEVYDGATRTLICGAALINPSWAITAARCVYTQSYQVIAMAGVYDRTDPINEEVQLRTIDADQIFTYPGFNPSNFANDIALIKFNEPYNLNIVGIKPICLPPTNATSYIQNPNCFVTGWGVTEVGGSFSNTLLRAGIDVIGDVNCGLLFDRVLLESEVCGYDQVSHSTGPCQGDYGAPLSCLVDANFFLAGVVSIVDDNCDGRIPQVFTDVPVFLDWILGVISPPPKT